MKVLCIKKWSSLFGDIQFIPDRYYEVVEQVYYSTPPPPGSDAYSIIFIKSDGANKKPIPFYAKPYPEIGVSATSKLGDYFKTPEEYRNDKITVILNKR